MWLVRGRTYTFLRAQRPLWKPWQTRRHEYHATVEDTGVTPAAAADRPGRAAAEGIQRSPGAGDRTGTLTAEGRAGAQAHGPPGHQGRTRVGVRRAVRSRSQAEKEDGRPGANRYGPAARNSGLDTRDGGDPLLSTPHASRRRPDPAVARISHQGSSRGGSRVRDGWLSRPRAAQA